MRDWCTLSSFVFSVGCLSCAAAAPSRANQTPRAARATEELSSTRWAYPADAGWTADQRAALTAWEAEVESLLRSEAFRVALRSLGPDIDDIYRDNHANSESVTDLSAVFALDAGTLEVVSGPIFLQNPTLTPSAGPDELSASGSSIHMLASTLADYGSNDVVKRSCAINSLAHEMSHLIGRRHDATFEPAFLDSTPNAACTMPANPGAPAVASYLVGSVAQCLWLQQHGRLAADPNAGRTDSVSLAECVNVFGVLNFNRARCWSFDATQALRERPDIPCPLCSPWSCNQGAAPHQPPCADATATPLSSFHFEGPNGGCWLK